MGKLSTVQQVFFKALKEIQENAVNVALCKHTEEEKLEDVLYDVTYNAMYDVMVLLDGYVKDSLAFDIIEKHCGESLRNGIELHDTCEEFLRY